MRDGRCPPAPERFLNQDASGRPYGIVRQLTTAVLLVFGVLTSPLSKSSPGIYVAIQTFLSFFQGPVFSILLLGIFWPRATNEVAYRAMTRRI